MSKKLSALMIVLVLLVAFASYRAGGAQAAHALAPGSAASQVVVLSSPASLSVQELRDALDAKYEHRCCGLPR